MTNSKRSLDYSLILVKLIACIAQLKIDMTNLWGVGCQETNHESTQYVVFAIYSCWGGFFLFDPERAQGLLDQWYNYDFGISCMSVCQLKQVGLFG
jgi:hypothetical protein